MEQTKIFRLLWQKREDGGARLLRAYGASSKADLPQQIDGHPLYEIAPYCFAETSRLPEQLDWNETFACDASDVPYLTELCSSRIEEVSLPDTVQSIGNCAFYNCKKLNRIRAGANLRDIGSDAFMNTLSFHRLTLSCRPEEASGIKQILSHISWDIKVRFQVGDEVFAALLYPEYLETYDEIAPAHLFGRSITGEGFRARQCVRDGCVDFAGYDAVFLPAQAEESEQTLSAMAFNRLRYPYALTEQNKAMYREYMISRISTVSSRMIRKKDLDALRFFCEQGLLYGPALTVCIQEASALGWTEGAAELLSRAALGNRGKKNRYSFGP